MKIAKEILEEIIKSMPLSPPEAGGIIGGNTDYIYQWMEDFHNRSNGCVYEPDVDYLNQVIAEWENNNILFRGIVHVHFGGAASLSKGDITYIHKIMQAMPESHAKLYFPIFVQPEKRLYVYVAEKDTKGNVKVRSEKLIII